MNNPFEPPWKKHLRTSFDYSQRSDVPKAAPTFVTAGKQVGRVPGGGRPLPSPPEQTVSTIVLGVGTGRCGTQSLSRFLNQQPNATATHERHIPIWGDAGVEEANFAIRELGQRRGAIAADVCFAYLPHLRRLLEADERVRVVAIRRDHDATIGSFKRKVAPRNHWVRHNGTRWRLDPYWDPRFPKYEDVDEGDLAAAVSRYWYDYYDQVEQLLLEYPERVLLVETESLNRHEGVAEIASFCQVAAPKLTVGVRTNASTVAGPGALTPADQDRMSIVIVTFKKGELLRNTIEGVRAQLAVNDEIVVVDDGGFDHEVVAPYLGPQVRYCAVPHDGYRLSLMCNVGTMMARNPKVVKLDGDCIPQPGWIAYMRARIGHRKLVAGRILWRHQNGSVHEDPRHAGKYPPTAVWGGSVGYMRDEFLAIGGFSNAYNGVWGAEDEDLGVRYEASGRRVIPTIGGVAVVHQFHPGNPHKGGRAKNLETLQQRRGAYRQAKFPDAAVTVPRIHVLLVHLGLRPYDVTLKRALASVGAALAGLDAKIWVVSQQATGEVNAAIAKQLKALGHDHELVTRPENLGLAEPKALVSKHVQPHEVLFTLDDDMTIPAGALRAMLAVPSADHQVGAVVLESPGLAMSSMSSDGGQIVKRPIAKTPPMTVVEHTGFGCSLITGRALQKCGFHPDYFVGGVDIDFSMQLKQAGLSTIVLSSYQAGHAPPKAPAYTLVRMNASQLENSRQIFAQRWGVIY